MSDSIYYLGWIVFCMKNVSRIISYFCNAVYHKWRLGLDDMSKGLKKVKQNERNFVGSNKIINHQRKCAELDWTVSSLRYKLFLYQGISSNTLPILMQVLWLLLDIRWLPVCFLHLHKIESFIVDSYSTIHNQVD